MSALLGTIGVKLQAMTAEFERGMKKAEGKLDSFGQKSGQMAKVAGTAFVGLAGAIGVVTRAASIQREAELKLESAIRGTGMAINADRIKQYAAELQKVTTFGDEVTISAAGMLTTFQLNEQQIIGLLPRVQNLAALYGMDLNTAAIAVGKALTAGAGALSRYGITLSDAEKKAFDMGTQTEKVAMLMKLLDKNTGPAAQMLAGTASGAFKQASNAVGDLAEQLGFIVDTPVAGILSNVTQKVSELTEWVKGWDEGTKKIVGTVVLLGTGLSGVLTAMGTMGFLLPKLIKGFSLIGMVLKKEVLTSLITLQKRLFLITGAVAGVLSIVGAVKNIKTGLTGTDEEKAALRDKYGMTGSEGILEGTMKGMKMNLVEGIKAIMDPLEEAMTGAADAVGSVVDPAATASAQLKQFEQAAGKSVEQMTSEINARNKKAEAGFDFTGSAEAEQFGIQIGKEMEFQLELQQRNTEIASQLSGSFGDQAQHYAMIANDLENMARNQDGITTYLRDTAMGMVNSIGELGTVIQSGIQGFTQGGVWGAVIAVFVELAGRTEAFAMITDRLNYSLNIAVQQVNPLIRALYPLINVITSITELGAKLVYNFGFLKPSIYALGVVVQAIADGITIAVNSMIDALASFVGNFSKDWARKIRKMRIDPTQTGYAEVNMGIPQYTGADIPAYVPPEIKPYVPPDIPQYSSSTVDFGSSLDGLANSTSSVATNMQDLDKTITDTTESLTNMPSGFKVEFARFASMGADTLRSIGVQRDQIAATSQTIERMYVTIEGAQNPQQLWDEMKKIMASESYGSLGSTLAAQPYYSTPQPGGK